MAYTASNSFMLAPKKTTTAPKPTVLNAQTFASPKSSAPYTPVGVLAPKPQVNTNQMVSQSPSPTPSQPSQPFGASQVAYAQNKDFGGGQYGLGAGGSWNILAPINQSAKYAQPGYQQQAQVDQAVPKQYQTTGSGSGNGGGGQGLTFKVGGQDYYSASGNKYDAVPGTGPSSGNVDYNSMINQGLSGNNQNPFPQVDNMNLDQANSTYQALQDHLNSQQDQQGNAMSYMDQLNQSRQQFGIPTLENTLQGIQSKLQQTNASQRGLYNQPQIDSMTGGVLQSGVTNAQSDIAGGRTPESYQNILQQQSLAEQGNLALGSLNRAQTMVGQNVSTYEAQNQLQLQQAMQQAQLLQMQADREMNPAKKQLLQAQAAQAQAQAQMYTSFAGGGGTMSYDQNGNPVMTSGGGGGGGQMPQQLAPYSSTDMNGQGFIVESRIPTQLTQIAKQAAAQAGIPIFSDAQASAMGSLDVTQQNMQSLGQLAQSVLGSGIGGRLAGLTTTQLQAYFQTNPQIQQMQAYREAAIKSIQALASGGSGLRINQSEIDSAVRNLPDISDNLETAQGKLQQVTQFLNNQRKALYNLGGLRTGSSGGSSSGGWGW